MNSVFEVQKTIREILLKILDHHSLEQLNKIPSGFNNNLIWNIAHCIASQQVLVYKLSGLPMMITDEMVDKYKNGSRPERDVTEAELGEIKILLFDTINKTITDYNNGIFKTYNEYTTSIGFNLKNTEEAIVYNNFHEGLHLGIMMTIRKFI